MKILDRIFNSWMHRKLIKPSYAQLGEDILMLNILKWLNISKPTYLDLGASHPVQLSNTFLLYQQGYRGVLVEADPFYADIIPAYRPEDCLLNLGVGVKNGEADFFIMKNKTENTFDQSVAEFLEKEKRNQIEKKIKLPIQTVNDIIAQNFEKSPDLISVDLEGLQWDILQSLDFELYRPKVLCVETKDEQHHKMTDLIDFVLSQGYFICADTFINSIFVDQKSWDQRSY
ncbi:MAG: FkbM family methyltransferase [Microscillaceae bacterium]|nr:FkbM family methyltransferase [Microscillaceae bacterium]